MVLPAAAADSPPCDSTTSILFGARVHIDENSTATNHTSPFDPPIVSVRPEKNSPTLGTQVCPVWAPLPRDPYAGRAWPAFSFPLDLNSLDVVRSGSSEIGVSWRTSLPTSARVAWGYEPGSFVGYLDAAGPYERSHFMRIAGLTPDVPVFVVVQSVSDSGEVVRGDAVVPAPPPVAGPSVSWLGVAVATAFVLSVGWAQERLARKRR